MHSYNFWQFPQGSLQGFLQYVITHSRKSNGINLVERSVINITMSYLVLAWFQAIVSSELGPPPFESMFFFLWSATKNSEIFAPTPLWESAM